LLLGVKRTLIGHSPDLPSPERLATASFGFAEIGHLAIASHVQPLLARFGAAFTVTRVDIAECYPNTERPSIKDAMVAD
jgi:hypothetical protein